MEQNRMFLDNFKYDYWILDKKLVWNGIFPIFNKITHISFNIGQRILNLHTMEHPFPSAGHIYISPIHAEVSVKTDSTVISLQIRVVWLKSTKKIILRILETLLIEPFISKVSVAFVKPSVSQPANVCVHLSTLLCL